MEELFRFTLTRPADRTDATTVPLQHNTQLQDRVTSAAQAGPAQERWAAMQKLALDFIKTYLSTWVEPLAGLAPQPPVPPQVLALRQLLAALQAVQPDSLPATWLGPIQTATTSISAADLATWHGNLADLFLALLIVRSIGPAAIDKVIPKIVVTQPVMPLNLQPSFAQILHDRPSLDEIANLLRMIDLIMNSASIPLKTVDDVKAVLTKTLALPPNIFSRFEKPVHAVGFTDLLVVKQHIARYELGEVAQIENILKGESRDHSQKHTLSNERDVVLDTSTQTETDQELTTTDHVSLQNEIDNTLKEDTKVDAGVHVQYDGGSVKAQADLTVGYDRSSSDSKKFASDIAKDITQKAAKKVTQKVQQTITTKVIETFEGTQDHSFDNKTGPANISGVYQWVEKVYLAQVFNYGKHKLFDIMVPEPAASLLLAAQTPPPDQKIPVPPDPLGTVKIDPVTKQPILDSHGNKQLDQPLRPDQLVDQSPPSDPNKLFYGDWIAKFQVAGVEPPPPETITVAKSFSEQASGGNVQFNETISLDDGYAAYTFSAAVSWKGQSGNPTLVSLIVGQQSVSWGPNLPAAPGVPKGGPGFIDHGSDSFSGLVQDRALRPDATGQPQPAEARWVGVAVGSVFSEEVAGNVEVQCKRTSTLFAKWQLQTYEKIAAAWQKLQSDYEQKISALQFQKGTTGPLGAADPERNRQIERTELKRSCIAILSNAPVDGSNDLVSETATSLFDPDPALAETRGSWVRWFEQAFEWDKIGYVFYPYYWGRSSEWIDRLNLKNDDPLFLNFLQAGYARAVVPVRNGFEDALNFYLLTGIPWLGGGLPKIWDKGQNPLYRYITEEMKELSGAPGDEKPVGDPWEIRLPTALIKLRDGDKLPMWKWDPPSTPPPPGTYPPSPPSLWSWSEDKESEQKE